MLWNVAVFGRAWQTAHDIGLGENGTDMNWVPETGYINVHYTLEQEMYINETGWNRDKQGTLMYINVHETGSRNVFLIGG